jgi:glycosyltransferase involved in cell wall biosynthesis
VIDVTPTPLVSIGVPVFNGANFVASAIESILAQTFADFELIICDNASTDATPEICRSFAGRDRRIRYQRNEHNLGAAQNFNLAFQLARGRYFKWAAHDDLIAPDFLRQCVAALEADPGAVLCQSLVRIIDAAGRELGIYDSALTGTRSRQPAERFAAVVLTRPLCTDLLGVIRSDVLRRTRLHLPYHGGDRALLTELALLGRFLQVREPLFLSREHPDRAERIVAPDELQRWYTPASARLTISPNWCLFRDYRRAVREHVPDPGERHRCRIALARWWFVEWNFARVAVDLIGVICPAVHGLVNQLKLRLYGRIPQLSGRR